MDIVRMMQDLIKSGYSVSGVVTLGTQLALHRYVYGSTVTVRRTTREELNK